MAVQNETLLNISGSLAASRDPSWTMPSVFVLTSTAACCSSVLFIGWHWVQFESWMTKLSRFISHRWAKYYESYQRPMQQSAWVAMECSSMAQSCHPIVQWDQNFHHFQMKERSEGYLPPIYLKYRHPIHRWRSFVELFSFQMDFIWISYTLTS